MDKETQGSLSTEARSYASYTYDHVENIIIKLRDMLRDIRCSIGLSRASKDILLGEALDSVDFVKKLMADSRQSLKNIEFISYYDDVESCPGDVADEIYLTNGPETGSIGGIQDAVMCAEVGQVAS